MTHAQADANPIERAIADERARVALQVNAVRIGGVAFWIVLAVAIGLNGEPEWLRPLPPLAIWIAIAIAIQATRRTRYVRYFWLATPLLDVPMVGWIQMWFVEVSIRPQVVAIFTVAIVASLVYISQLSFTWRSVIATLAGALVVSALEVWKSALPFPNMLSAILLLGSAAAIAGFSSSRVRFLVTTIARDQGNREAELAALVAARTAELESAHASLVRAERMASVSMLVQGIAHELNNPINYMAGNIPPLDRYVQFVTAVARQLADGTARTPEQLAAILSFDGKRDLAYVASDLEALTADIAEGARRARLIIGDLQNLTSGSNRPIEDVELERVVRQTQSLFAQRLPPGVALAIEVEPMPPVRAAAGQIEQLLVNLVDNALRATTSGRVEIRLARDGECALLSVRDQGSGMTETARARACEPFFTTRRAGDGAGLGLAIVAQIVEAHHGTLAIESAPGKGTTVTARLPLP